jgi:hypothetical protein
MLKATICQSDDFMVSYLTHHCAEEPMSPGPEPMSDKERAQGFIDLYKQQMQQRHTTQGIEWRVNIGYWTLLAGANYFAAQHRVALPSLWIVRSTCILTVVMHLFWLIKIQHSENYDKILWIEYRKKALHLMGYDPPSPPKRNWFMKGWFKILEWRALWLLPEMWLTVALSALLWWLLTQPVVEKLPSTSLS